MSEAGYPLPLGCPNAALRIAFRDDLPTYCRVMLFTALTALTSEEAAERFTSEQFVALEEAGMVMAEQLMDGNIYQWDAHVELSVAVMAAVVTGNLEG